MGVHKLPPSKAKPLSGLEKGLSLIVSGVGGGRDARRKERQEQSRKQKEAEAVQERAPAVLKNLARVLKPANGGHKLGALAAAVKRGEALQEELPKDSKLRHQLAAAIEAARAILAAIEERDLKHLADCSEAAQRLLAEATGRRVDKSSAPAAKAAAAKVVGAAAAMAAGLAKRASAR